MPGRGLSITREEVISHNTWVHRIVRTGVTPLAKTPIHPNHLTTLRLVTGVGAAVLFALGDPAWRWEAIALLVVSLLFDRADGELARQTGRTSRFGHVYDLFADGASNAALFTGIGLGLPDSALGGWGAAIGIAAGIAVVGAEFLVMRAHDTGAQNTKDMGNFFGFDPDDGMFLVPVALAFGWDAPLVVVAAIGASIAVLILFMILLRGPKPPMSAA